MIYTRINNTEHPFFVQAWELYKKSFPPEERRQLSTQRKTIQNPLYHCEFVTDKATLVGFIMWWEFDDVRYVEHLATVPILRGKGYGARILSEFISRSGVPVLLEVEHPTDEMSRRRIGFYERAGFVLNEHEYRHPPYKRGGEYVPLMLMTWPSAITADEARHFCERHHPVIFEHSKCAFVSDLSPSQPSTATARATDTGRL